MLLAILSLGFWLVNPQSVCTARACLEIPGLFGWSWYLWGALFYALAAMLITSTREKIKVLGFLFFGVLFHAGLLVYGYVLTESICITCLKFAGMELILFMAYLVPSGLKDEKLEKPNWAIPAHLMVLIISGMFFIPQGTFEGPYSSNASLSVTSIDLSKPTEEVWMRSSETINSEKIAHATVIPVEDKSVAKKARDNQSANSPHKPLGLKVTVPGGDQELYLDLNKKQALVFAAWCSHCNDALKDVAKLKEKERPYLIVTYLREGDIEKVQKKLAVNGLEGVDYYLLFAPPPEIQSVPVIVGQKDS